MDRLTAFREGTEPCARQTHDFRYSEVFLEEYPATHLAVIGSVEAIPFAKNVDYFTQADAFEKWINVEGLVKTGGPLFWNYHNSADQPLQPGGNPVREPFEFEAGFEVEAPAEPLWKDSKTAGAYFTRELRALRVASVFYEGSFPYQGKSGFADAWMTLVTQAPVLGYELSGRLYREIYHWLDDENPAGSITEIQVEISMGGAG